MLEFVLGLIPFVLLWWAVFLGGLLIRVLWVAISASCEKRL